MKHWMSGLMAVLLALVVSSCSWSSDGGHIPPPGMGSIIVLNNSGTSFNLTINGVVNAAETAPDANPFYDLQPGTYIITLQQTGGVRHWTGGVNVQLGRRTYMDVVCDPVVTTEYDVVSYVE
jgi:hypothetical protein